METLPTLLNRKDESSWQKASASLDASAKIYGYRVDSVHSETFKFLGGLSRTDMKEEGKENIEDESSADSNSRDRKRGGEKVTVYFV
jgi:condensin complex subunit 2